MASTRTTSLLLAPPSDVPFDSRVCLSMCVVLVSNLGFFGGFAALVFFGGLHFVVLVS